MIIFIGAEKTIIEISLISYNLSASTQKPASCKWKDILGRVKNISLFSIVLVELVQLENIKKYMNLNGGKIFIVLTIQRAFEFLKYS